jgi:hypothetical protein
MGNSWIEEKVVGKGLDAGFSKFGTLLQDFANKYLEEIRHRMGGESQAQQHLTFKENSNHLNNF